MYLFGLFVAVVEARAAGDHVADNGRGEGVVDWAHARGCEGFARRRREDPCEKKSEAKEKDNESSRKEY